MHTDREITTNSASSLSGAELNKYPNELNPVVVKVFNFNTNIWCFSITNDGKYIAVVDKNQIKILDISTSKVKREIGIKEQIGFPPDKIAFTFDNQNLIISIWSLNKIALLNIETGKITFEDSGRRFKVHPKLNYLALVDANDVKVLSLDGRMLFGLQLESANDDISFSPLEDVLVVGSDENFKFYQLNGEVAQTIHEFGGYDILEYSPRGRYLAAVRVNIKGFFTSSYSYSIKLINLIENKEINISEEIYSKEPGLPFVTFSPNEQLLVLIKENNAYFYSVEDGHKLIDIKCRDLKFCPDGRYVVTIKNEDTIEMLKLY
ncbi:WD40 repeat domain-containing protein [Parageobacillus toebii]|uniref:WD40 repeat domain-containing protein n=1 Tax=Parageobacillus toebii TaxID=153151 RepID=UPI002815CF9B|nr:hypothetical protein [Parageobacillus toebii]WMT18171.1 hypothetical protein RFB12_12700 [Parageobacillus toebii]